MKQISTKIGELIQDSKKQLFTQINTIMVKTYWEIGRIIVEEEQNGNEKAKYGSNLLKKLSEELTKKHGKGFSRDNLENMRKFYLTFPISETLSRKLGWSHYTTLLRIEDKLKRDFYLKDSEEQKWSVRELKRQINSALFERLALSKDKKGILELAQKGQIIGDSKDLIKDPYILEFLNLEEFNQLNETELEQKLIDNLEKFILELGKGFMFVSRQKRITLDNTHFYIDLVFYNRLLKSFVIIELKTNDLKHQHLGQLQMYVNYYDREIKQEDENPTIGILLCLDKKQQIVEYTLPKENNSIFASKYKLYLPDKKELEQKVKNLLEEELIEYKKY